MGSPVPWRVAWPLNVIASRNWDPGNRLGSWKPDSESTSINRYVIDFRTMVQTNIDNQRKRSVRIVWLRRQDLTAQYSGQTTA